MTWLGPTRAERRFALPREPRAPLLLWALALGVHLAFAAVWRTAPHGYDPAVRSPWREFLPIALGAPAPEVTMRYRGPRANAARPLPAPTGRSLPTLPAPLEPRVARPAVSRDPLALQVLTTPVVDTPPTSHDGVIGARFAEGRVWLRPLPATPKQIASALTGRSQAELADSAVNQMVQQYLDAMAKEAETQHDALPSWTTKVAGQLVGLDAKWLYLGPLKIPTALLALLPINLQGNPTQADFNRRLSVMRADLFDAARRADNLAEFKKAVKELRTETERKREFSRNQRTAPDSGKQ
ncbi:MAG: hypothetical protein V4503_10740 [Gemmatimonadota bacterium]